jgi:hypothetical protein
MRTGVGNEGRSEDFADCFPVRILTSDVRMIEAYLGDTTGQGVLPRPSRLRKAVEDRQLGKG